MHRFVLSLALIASATSFALAGPITPPPGPVGSTPGPEPRIAINTTNTPGDADSLFKITQPGSYYLAGNITGVASKHGIEIASAGVTVDLNGFELSGVSGALDGVSSSLNFLSNIEVRNGSIRNWGGDGVDLLSLTVRSSIVAGVRCSSNGGMGIGIGNSSTLTESEVSSNIGAGILTGHGCTISGCTASNNGGVGMATSSGCTVTDSSFYQNTSHGLELADGGMVFNCAASDNSGTGITASNGCTIISSTAYSNADHGIDSNDGCTISGCTSVANERDGVRVGNSCSVIGNTCRENGDGTFGRAGIQANGSDNRIEGNTCTNANRGIRVNSAGNIIIRNTCSGNTVDWDIVANNIYGQIIDRRTPASVAVNGFVATGTLGSTDANANFSY